MESGEEADNGNEATGRDGWFWATVALSAFTGLSAILVATRVTWSFGNRHFDLPGFVDAVWEPGSYLVNAREFTIAYLVLPIIWVGASLWWWARRPGPWSWAQWLVFAAFAVVTIVGMAAWFATAIEQVAWAFDIDGVPGAITTFGIGPADLREPVIAIGLACLVLAALGNLTAMLFASAGNRSSTDF
jgi:hypothetical protein